MSDIPQSIITALTKYQDRPFILYLEKDLIKFIKNSILGNIKQPEYVIQAQYLKNSYYRLLSHQLCHYYHLQHWNNQSNEIVVTPLENFDYSAFLIKIEDESGGDFVKVADVAHKYQPTHSPDPPSQNGYTTTHPQQHHHQNHYSRNRVYHSPSYNNNHNQYYHYHQHPQYSHSHSHNYQPYSSTEHVNSTKNTETPPVSHPQPFKPKMIVKKIISKPVASPSSNTTTTAASDVTATADNNANSSSSVEDLSRLKIDEVSSSAPPSEGSDESSLNTTSSTTMESQRATKEALYKKVRDEIFLKEDNEQNGEEEEEDDDDDDDNNNNNDEQVEEGAEDKERGENKSYTKERYPRSNYRKGREYTPGHHKNQRYSVPYQIPIPMQYPHVYHPHHNSGSPAIPQANTVPVLYNPYYPTVHAPLVPQTYAAAGAAPPYAPAFQGIPTFDTETERRILNNPYIILPGDLDTNGRSKNPSKNNQSFSKTKRTMYQNGNGSGASIGRNNTVNAEKP
ncbi:hypothetical protein KGF57_005300 [Candida theae]|uniref:R3H domain-containing protein n=1 Tax=Candida theae TaxID=1198502 RepID=A0AAD5B9S0_9ASCO|nr:uncharacterized protein KGF57_005300 [Candida theae]KAI5948689.1 hypothetical protein KGF57_005300 [Candida theae]